MLTPVFMNHLLDGSKEALTDGSKEALTALQRGAG